MSRHPLRASAHDLGAREWCGRIEAPQPCIGVRIRPETPMPPQPCVGVRIWPETPMIPASGHDAALARAVAVAAVRSTARRLLTPAV